MLVEQPALFEGLADWLEEGSERPGAVGDAIEKAQDGVREAKLGALHAITATLGLTTGTVDAGLGELQARVDRHRDRIAAQRAETRELREKLQQRMLVVTVTSSLSLVWILFSQAVTFVLGLSLYRGENYFERWLAPAEGDAKPGRDRPAAGGSS